jgi:predicted dehydrogenase/threonine dehydrogenase-like Zn-dependent dehydrogenase
MKQLTQNIKTGKMKLLEVPYPALNKGYVLVRNYYSAISAGTEGGKVITAKKGYIGKAKEKPEQVKQVLESVKSEGLFPTYKKVMSKLDAPAPLGYSCVGEVLDIDKNISDIKIGDIIACGGASAGHAEVVSVPRNLCVRVPDNIEIKYAAYTTIGSIALQGIRQANVKLGENCVVIGLGLIGQLTIQMLKAAGVSTIGIDIDKHQVEKAIHSGADMAFERNDFNLENSVNELSRGYGVDAVIITAGTNSLDPVELAGRLCRKRGKVVIVGAVPTGFSRENYYKKELSLLMSSSYGPGRYDLSYEEMGIDYPIAFARWTENRNMQAFLDLAASNALDLDLITTHIFPFEDEEQAYNMIIEKSEMFTGILLEYNTEKKLSKKIILKETEVRSNIDPNIGFIGAGSFASKYLLPNASKYGNMIGVCAAAGNNTRNAADKHHFDYATGDYQDILTDDRINTVFIATRHNMHALQVIESIKNSKNTFVEKPLCLTIKELDAIKNEYEKRKVHLMVGFNRRFSPFIQKTMDILGSDTKKAINFRINAGTIPSDSWIQDKSIGGGRILGEVCHFVDLAMFVAGAPINKVSAFAMEDPDDVQDTLNVILNFTNGSIANISFFANGSKAIKKENLEIFSNGKTIVINDFKEMNIFSKSKKKKKLINQNKGHAKEVELFLTSIKMGSDCPISFNEIYLSTLATFKIIDSIRTGKTQEIAIP